MALPTTHSKRAIALVAHLAVVQRQLRVALCRWQAQEMVGARYAFLLHGAVYLALNLAVAAIQLVQNLVRVGMARSPIT